MSTTESNATSSATNVANPTIKLNLAQNHLDFKLELIENQSPLFRKKLFSKTLDPLKKEPEKPENYRTVMVKYLYPSC